MIHIFGSPERFFPKGTVFSKRPPLGMALDEVYTGENGGHDKLAKALVTPRPFERGHGLIAVHDCPTVVALGRTA